MLPARKTCGSEREELLADPRGKGRGVRWAGYSDLQELLVGLPQDALQFPSGTAHSPSAQQEASSTSLHVSSAPPQSSVSPMSLSMAHGHKCTVLQPAGAASTDPTPGTIARILSTLLGTLPTSLTTQRPDNRISPILLREAYQDSCPGCRLGG